MNYNTVSMDPAQDVHTSLQHVVLSLTDILRETDFHSSLADMILFYANPDTSVYDSGRSPALSL